MPRPLTAPFLRSMLEPESAVFPLQFLQLTHPDVENIFVVNDVTQVKAGTHIPYVFLGKSWIAYPFELPLLSDVGDIPECKLSIQNVDRRIGLAIAQISEPVRVSVFVYSSADFAVNGAGTAMIPIGTPTRQYPPPDVNPLFFLRDVRVGPNTVTGVLKPYDPSREPYPYIRADATTAPALAMR